jgi:outer membrane protein assembly factor BamB
MRRAATALVALALAAAVHAQPSAAAESLSIQPSIADAFLNASSVNANAGGTTTLLVRSLTAQRRRPVLRFSLAGIPIDASVKSASLVLCQTAAPSSNRTLQVRRITESWTEGGVTWNSRDGSNSWSTAGGATAGATSTTTTNAAAASGSCAPGSGNVGFNTWNVLADVTAWMSGTTNNGHQIRDNAEGGTDRTTTFASKEHATTSIRPRLDVTYLSPVQDFTITGQSGQALLYWTLPGGAPAYNGALVIRRTGTAPTSNPSDGTNYTVGNTLGDGSVVVLNNTALATTFTSTGLTNGTTYFYRVYARDSAHRYSPASPVVSVTPAAAPAGASWSHSTTAASLAAPGLLPEDRVFVASNDGRVHVVDAVTGARSFAPFSVPGGAAIQGRPTIIPFDISSTGVDVAYVAAQDGRVYAIDAQTGAQLWQSAVLGNTLQGGPAVWLQFLAPRSFTTDGTATAPGPVTADIVLVGTRNTGVFGSFSNKLVALNGNTGATVWTFNASVSHEVNVVSSTPYIDYSQDTVWFTSRRGPFGFLTRGVLWKLDVLTGALIDVWDPGSAVDVDAAPSPSLDGLPPTTPSSVLYVGGSNGQLWAFPLTGPVAPIATHTPGSGSGAIKGFPVPLSTDPITPGTPDTVVFTRDTTIHAVQFDGTQFVTTPPLAWTTTLTGSPTVSAPIDGYLIVTDTTRLYVGASDGELHQLDPATGADQAQRTLGTGITVGDPSVDALAERVYAGTTDGRVYAFDIPF